MEHDEILAGLVEKLRRNREKVPLKVLKTRYAAAYNLLCSQICEELNCIALKLPNWLEGKEAPEKYILEIAEIFNRLYAEGGYAKALGLLVFKEMNARGAAHAARELNRMFTQALEEYALTKCCLYVPESCLDPEHPQAPKIYNAMLSLFWDEERRAWRKPRPGELQPAILIFIDRD